MRTARWETLVKLYMRHKSQLSPRSMHSTQKLIPQVRLQAISAQRPSGRRSTRLSLMHAVLMMRLIGSMLHLHCSAPEPQMLRSHMLRWVICLSARRFPSARACSRTSRRVHSFLAKICSRQRARGSYSCASATSCSVGSLDHTPRMRRSLDESSHSFRRHLQLTSAVA